MENGKITLAEYLKNMKIPDYDLIYGFDKIGPAQFGFVVEVPYTDLVTKKTRQKKIKGRVASGDIAGLKIVQRYYEREKANTGRNYGTGNDIYYYSIDNFKYPDWGTGADMFFISFVKMFLMGAVRLNNEKVKPEIKLKFETPKDEFGKRIYDGYITKVSIDERGLNEIKIVGVKYYKGNNIKIVNEYFPNKKFDIPYTGSEIKKKKDDNL